ncbi:MAG: ATP-binding cassette domain-containing protein, partial [Chloroflexota bacterium]|nr:ATP-binding cassette domain-containing protein [Chloroflexota bacterium]
EIRGRGAQAADQVPDSRSPAPDPRPPAPGLEVREAHRACGGVVAVDEVSIQVRPGTIVGLIGANGAGKSTLLNLISGVEPLERGCVRLNGEDLTALSAAERARRGIVRTFQVPRLIDALSVVENITLGREAAERPAWKRSPAAERGAAAEARRALAGVGLAPLADRPARSLGTGERKYVELVRAIFSDARLLLFDEPAVGLSLDELEELRRRLNAMRRAGTAILVIDHNIDFIRSLADYVYVMDSGRVVREGAVGEVALTGSASRPAASEPAAAERAFQTGPGQA